MTERRDLLAGYVPLAGTGGFGFLGPDEDDPDLRHSTIDQIDYVVVPPEYLPRTFVDRVCDLAVKFAADLGVKTPEIRFFVPAVTAPEAWRAFRAAPIWGRVAAADLGRIWLHIGSPQLASTIAHETAHAAGRDEDGARAYAKEQQEKKDA